MKKGYKVVINNQSNTATIYIYGAISDWSGDVSALKFVQEYNTLKKSYPSLELRMNCPGGDVFEGLPIFNCIKANNDNTHLYVDGLAASMGFMISMAVKKENRHISKYAKCMSHKVNGGASGSAEKLKEMANLMEQLDNDFISILSADTGKTADQIKKTYLKEGTDCWLSAQQCVDDGLFNDLYDGDPTQVPANLSSIDITNFFNQEPKTESNMKNLGLFIAVFAAANMTLPADATEDVVLAKVKDVLESNKKLIADLAAANTKLEAAKVAEINNMIDAAEKAKKITANMKENYLKLAKADFDSCKKILDEMKPYESVQNILNNKSEQTDDKRKDWSFSDWQKKDTKGLAKMKAEDKDAYAALLKSIPNREV